MLRSHLSAARGLVTWAVATCLAVGLAQLLAHDLRGRATTTDSFAVTLTTLCEVVLVGCVAWAWLATTAVVVEVLLALRARAPRPLDRPGLPGVPTRWRHLVLLGCGVVLVAGASVPAQATPGAVQVTSVQVGPSGGTDRGGPARLSGLPLPERATDPWQPRALAAAEPAARPGAGVSARRPPPPASQQVVVGAGDTLWAIARAHLGEGQRSDAEVGAHWRQIYALNRAVLGADPDLVVPGQRLTLPSSHRP
ncbi:MAG: LysM peptidoglycan-binding domain-containing protein [Nocardioides sp.]|nr:LysM peptidoglycan-binding domain-containing protein [Nocardioides sp.]